MRNFYKGLLFGLPISMALWAVIALSAADVAERHPHAFAHAEAAARRHLGLNG